MAKSEWETLKWVDRYNTERLHSAIAYVTPQEAQEAFYENLNADDKAALTIEPNTLR
ncbi:MAG: integrase core domain-containing protein [Paracoccaceae bacterium]